MIIEDGIALRLNPFHRVCNYFLSGLNGLGIVCLLLGVWEIGAQAIGGFILPPPLLVLERTFAILKATDNAISITLYRCVIAITLAFCAGSLFGILSGSFDTLSRITKPLMDIFLAIPPIIWIVLALFWFGMGSISVVFSVFVATFPLSFGNASLSVRSLDKSLAEVCIVYRLSLAKRLKCYYIPHILPYLLNSLNLTMAMGVKIMIMSELLGASDGVGAKIADARSYLDTTEVLAYIVIMVGLVLLFDFLVIKPLKIVFLPWLEDGR